MVNYFIAYNSKFMGAPGHRQRTPVSKLNHLLTCGSTRFFAIGAPLWFYFHNDKQFNPSQLVVKFLVSPSTVIFTLKTVHPTYPSTFFNEL